VRVVRLRGDLLVGRMVRDADGRKAGRIHEMTIEPAAPGSTEYVVREFRLSGDGWLEALAGRELASALARRSGRPNGRTVSWEDLDLSDPVRPKLRRTIAELDAARAVSPARSPRGDAARS